jgi:hypothetical protein
VYFPRGTYIVSAATLAVPSNVRWMGDGQGASIIRLKSGANGRMLSQTSTQSNVEFRDLTFDFNACQPDGRRDPRRPVRAFPVEHHRAAVHQLRDHRRPVGCRAPP